MTIIVPTKSQSLTNTTAAIDCQWTKVVDLAKFSLAVYEISFLPTNARAHTRTHGRLDAQPEHVMPPQTVVR